VLTSFRIDFGRTLLLHSSCTLALNITYFDARRIVYRHNESRVICVSCEFIITISWCCHFELATNEHVKICISASFLGVFLKIKKWDLPGYCTNLAVYVGNKETCIIILYDSFSTQFNTTKLLELISK